MSLHARAGPVTRATLCDHGGPTLPTDPDDLDLITACEEDAVLFTPWPSESVVGTVALCEFHLARLVDAYPEFEATLREVLKEHGDDLDWFLPENAFVHIDDAPEQIEKLDRTWFRLGLDQHGRVHYRSKAGGTVLVVDGELEVEQVQALDQRSLKDWLEVTRMVRGWAEIDPERVEFYTEAEA